MRQEKIKCNARERKRVNEHFMKRGEKGEGGRWGGEMVATRGVFFATRHHKVSNLYVTYKKKVLSYLKYAGY